VFLVRMTVADVVAVQAGATGPREVEQLTAQHPTRVTAIH